LLVVAVLSACGDRIEPAKACDDLLDAFSTRAFVCGMGDVTVVRAQFDAIFDCSSVVSIRDEDELYYDCIPDVDGLACDELQAGRLPESCRDQLEHN
jgi:hypothetical protein